jgi:hypothetical protein
MTNADVMKMVAAGLSKDLVLLAINNSEPRFSLLPAQLDQLIKAGVSEDIIKAMAARQDVRPQSQPAATSVPTRVALSGPPQTSLPAQPPPPTGSGKVPSNTDGRDPPLSDTYQVGSILSIPQGYTAGWFEVEVQSKSRRPIQVFAALYSCGDSRTDQATLSALGVAKFRIEAEKPCDTAINIPKVSL